VLESCARILRSCWPALLAALLATAPARAATVAVLDTGIDFSDPLLAAHIASGGRDLVDNDPDPSDEDPGRHGSLVSAIILGTSPSALILPVRVLDASGEGSNFDIARGLSYVAATSARVINLSLGDPEGVYDPVLSGALQNAARANKVIVMAAGNEGQPQPNFPGNLADELAGNAITVGATDAPGVIADYSNRAGDSMQYFLVAPGSDPATGAQGTSFATPRVAGAAAEVLAQNPSLTNTQVVDILLSSTDDRGAPGTDPVYGRGELNLEHALQARGVMSVPSGSSGGGSSIGAGALVLAAGLVAALTLRSKTLPKTLVLDSYGRPYGLDLGALLEPADREPDLASLLEGNTRDMGYLELNAGRATQLAVWYARAERDLPDTDGPWRRATDEPGTPANWAAELRTAPSPDWQLSAAVNTDPRNGFGARRVDTAEVPLATGLAGAALGGSYLGFAATAQSMRAGWQPTSSTRLAFGYNRMDEDQPHGLHSEAAVAEASTRPAAGVEFALALSRLNERGSLLGGSSGGPLGVDRSGTLAGTVSARWQPHERLLVAASYGVGFTHVDAGDASLFTDVSGLRSRTWGAGVIAANVFDASDRVGLSISQPMRIVSGQARLSVPYARDVRGTVWFRNEDVALDAPGTELDLEVSYHRALGRHGALAAWMQYRRHPDHDPAASPATTAFTALRWNF